jgi:hypothetical protein
MTRRDRPAKIRTGAGKMMIQEVSKETYVPVLSSR